MRLLVTACLVLFATVAPAVADPHAGPSETATDCARAHAAGKACSLSIEEETVEGKVPTTGETALALAQFTHAASLIQLRRDFIPEIIKTAEDL